VALNMQQKRWRSAVTDYLDSSGCALGGCQPLVELGHISVSGQREGIMWTP